MPQSRKKFALVTDLDELQTFVGNKRNKLWIWTAVNHKQAGILAWVIGDRSAETFEHLWLIVKCLTVSFMSPMAGKSILCSSSRATKLSARLI
jgi:hypothetical protein